MQNLVRLQLPWLMYVQGTQNHLPNVHNQQHVCVGRSDAQQQLSSGSAQRDGQVDRSHAANGPLQHSGIDQQTQQPQEAPNQQQHAPVLGHFSEALFQVLQQPQLPSTCLWHIAWLLAQLLAHDHPPSSQLPAACQQLLDEALQAGQAGLVEQLQGMWCDALPLLVVWEWDRARQAIAESHNVSTATAVQAWLQVALLTCCHLIHRAAECQLLKPCMPVLVPFFCACLLWD